MRARLLLSVCALLIGLTSVMAQMPGEMPPPEHPVVILGPPEGFEPPEPPPPMPPDPEAGKQMMLDMFFQFMAGPDGVIDRGEFQAWVRDFHMPPPDCDFNGDGMVDEVEAEQCGKMGPPPECDLNGDGMIDQFEAEECAKHMPPPPECDLNGDGMIDQFEAEECAKAMGPPPCSDELRESELMPQAEGMPCGDRAGNLIFRTICNMPGYDMVAISLPDGRAASCFDVESMREAIEFEIVTETGDLIWEPGMGKEAFMALKLDAGMYHIRSRGGSPEGAVTVRFVDVPVE